MTGSLFVRVARLTALVLALPVLVGARPLSTALRVVSSGVDQAVNQRGSSDTDRGIDHSVNRFTGRGIAHEAVEAIAPVAGDTIVVAARDLPRGTVLRAADIEMVVTNAENATTAIATVANSANDLPAAGWVVRRLVHKGETLRAPAVAPPVLIPAGSPVSLVWEVGELRVTRTGTAVGAAYAGETVTVRVDARRRFTGIATAPGTVVVSQP